MIYLFHCKSIQSLNPKSNLLNKLRKLLNFLFADELPARSLQIDKKYDHDYFGCAQDH